MTDKEIVEKYQSITDYPPTKQLEILMGICNLIYIGRNISCDQSLIIRQLEKIDRLFRDREEFSQKCSKIRKGESRPRK